MASTFETNTLAKVKFFLGMKRNQTMKRGCLCSVATSYLSLQEPHGLQQASLLCPSLSPGICSNSCLLLGIPGGSDGKKKKKTAYNVGDLGLIPELGRSPKERKHDPSPVCLPGESHGQRRASP